MKAYASAEALKNACVDPRFKYVERGCAPYVEWLGVQENPRGKGWAAEARYGKKILSILNAVIGTAGLSGTSSDNTAVKAFVPYQVKVTASDLIIRTGPGTNYAKTGKYAGNGIFTIVEESSGAGSAKGWGKLKSGDGWIALGFAQKV